MFALVNSPLLSICIPTRNRAQFLHTLLESIARQVTPAVEVVISDDASTDDTASLIESFRPRLPRLTYEKVDPAFRYDRNLLHAVALARGEFCWLFGDDDRLEPGGSLRCSALPWNRAADGAFC